jgi:hypothetical protein
VQQAEEEKGATGTAAPGEAPPAVAVAKLGGSMSVFDLFNEFDQVIMLKFGDLEAALDSERGKQLLQQLLAEEIRPELRAWCNRFKGRPLNLGAAEMKQRLERELGETL